MLEVPPLRARPGDVPRLAVHAALAKHGGNERAAAAELGVSPKTLYSKLAKYG